MTTGERLANGVLAGSAALGTLGFGYVIYSYDWTQTSHFSSPVDMALYHLLPAAVAILLFAALRMRPSHKINLSLLLLSTSTTVYLLQLLMPSVASMANPREVAARKAGVAFDARGWLEVTTDLRKTGLDAYPTSNGRMLLQRRTDDTLKSRIAIDSAEVLPLASIANKVGVFCNESGDWVIYGTDEHGFHNPRGIWDLGHVSIAAVGDSFTDGYCVPSDQSFMALIRQQYPDILNLAKGANGPLFELAGIKEYLPYVKPRVVLWFFFEGNDLCDLRVERHSPLLIRYVQGEFTQGLMGRQAEIDRALEAYLDGLIAAKLNARESREPQWLEDHLRRLMAFLTIRRVRERLGILLGGRQPAAEAQANPYGCVDVAGAQYLDVFRQDEMELFRTVLLQAKASVGTWGGRLQFVYLPDWQRYDNPAKANRDRDRVLTLVRGLEIPVIDIHQAFEAQSDPLALFPFRLPGHYNREGHRVVAEAVLRALARGSE